MNTTEPQWRLFDTASGNISWCHQAITWTNVDQLLSSLWHNELSEEQVMENKLSASMLQYSMASNQIFLFHISLQWFCSRYPFNPFIAETEILQRKYIDRSHGCGCIGSFYHQFLLRAWYAFCKKIELHIFIPGEKYWEIGLTFA